MYDVVIVGSGTAGQSAAFYLKEKGMNVALVEKSARPGGTCALAGCQPKKWFYEVAEAIDRTRHLLGKGIVTTAEGSWRCVLEQKQKYTSSVPEKTIKHVKDAGIAFLPGTAMFIDEKTLSINKEKIQSRFFVLATGARPMALPIDGIEHVITSSEFLELKTLPSSIIGEGADVTIIAGCGIHRGGKESEGHSGIHEFQIKAGAKVKYVGKHIAIGEGTDRRIFLTPGGRCGSMCRRPVLPAEKMSVNRIHHPQGTLQGYV